MVNDITKYILLTLLLSPVICFAQNASDYLILNDISDYKYVTKMKDFFTDEMKTIPGYTRGNHPGILAGSDHFSIDHIDIYYETTYYSQPLQIALEVQVTQHTSGDSDQWLLHELERDFRTYYGLPGDSYVVRQINGQYIFAVGSGGWTYRWLSGSRVVNIEYTDLQFEKSEPIEVVQAYIAKHPSTLLPSTSAELRTEKNKTAWIKDEMERRLWLADKWFANQSANKTDVSKTLREINDHLESFLEYRDKYYGINSDKDKQTLYQYLSMQNLQGMKDKLNQYRSWWSKNKWDKIPIK